jgi:hypothetical protein
MRVTKERDRQTERERERSRKQKERNVTDWDTCKIFIVLVAHAIPVRIATQVQVLQIVQAFKKSIGQLAKPIAIEENLRQSHPLKYVRVKGRQPLGMRARPKSRVEVESCSALRSILRSA